MFVTGDQLLAHVVGDYVLQSDWMAGEKRRRTVAALVHALTYGIPFLLLRPSLLAFAVIVGSHLLIDRFGLARYLVWTKNQVGPREFRRPWSECSVTGYPAERPAWMAVWLLIIADNALHVAINAAALRWL